MSLNIAELELEMERVTAETGGQGGDFLENFVKMPEGNGAVTLRLLPPAEAGMFGKERNHFYCATRTHKVNDRSLHCPKTLQGKKWVGECPICSYYSWLWGESESEQKTAEEAKHLQAQARAIKPVERYYFNCIVRQQFNEKTQEMEKNVGPKILSVGKMVYGLILKAIVGNKELEEEPLGDVTHLLNGRDFKLIKTMRQSGKDNFPNYSESKFLDPSPLGDKDQVKRWLESLHDLSSLRTVKTVDELKHELKIHLGLIADDAGTSGFDPKEFQRSDSSSTSASVTVLKEVVKEPESSKDQPLVEDDFVASLRKISS